MELIQNYSRSNRIISAFSKSVSGSLLIVSIASTSFELLSGFFSGCFSRWFLGRFSEQFSGRFSWLFFPDFGSGSDGLNLGRLLLFSSCKLLMCMSLGVFELGFESLSLRQFCKWVSGVLIVHLTPFFWLCLLCKYRLVCLSGDLAGYCDLVVVI